MQFLDKKYYLYIIVGMLGVVLIVCHWIKTTKMGYQLAAVANNQDAAESLCVNSRALKLKAMAISAFLCAMGGTFYAQVILFCNPARLFSEALSDKLAIVAMLGGKGTVFGPTAGALIVETISQFASAKFANIQGLNLAIYGIMLIVCIRFFPDGILPIIQKVAEEGLSQKGGGGQMSAILQVEHLSKHFGGLKAVNDFSMTVEQGEIHALIGPNGAGKTTLFNLIFGIYPPFGGQGLFRRPRCDRRKALSSVRQRAGAYLPDRAALPRA